MVVPTSGSSWCGWVVKAITTGSRKSDLYFSPIGLTHNVIRPTGGVGRFDQGRDDVACFMCTLLQQLLYFVGERMDKLAGR